jgi:hypothetical protein
LYGVVYKPDCCRMTYASLLYFFQSQKLSELVRSEARSQEQESVMETQARRIVKDYVIPNVNNATASVNGFVSKNTEKISLASLFDLFKGK